MHMFKEKVTLVKKGMNEKIEKKKKKKRKERMRKLVSACLKPRSLSFKIFKSYYSWLSSVVICLYLNSLQVLNFPFSHYWLPQFSTTNLLNVIST